MRIASSQPYLDIHTTNAVVRVEREPVRLVATHKRAQMRVNTTRPTFKVSKKQLHTSSAARNAEAQRQRASEHRKQIMERGLSGSLSDVSQGQSPQELASASTADLIASLTISRMSSPGMDAVASAPDNSVAKVDWDPGTVEIEWDPYKLEMSWEGDMRPKITVTPHTVEIRLINGKTVRVGENEAKALEMQGYGKRMDEKI